MGYYDCRALLCRARNDSSHDKVGGHCEDPDEIGRRSNLTTWVKVYICIFLGPSKTKPYQFFLYF
jgi:hypothetical protein